MTPEEAAPGCGEGYQVAGNADHVVCGGIMDTRKLGGDKLLCLCPGCAEHYAKELGLAAPAFYMKINTEKQT